MTTVDMYKKFRQELDELCVPVIVDELTISQIKHNAKVVGMLGTREMVPDEVYIDCLYILPEYRRQGFARKAVMEFYEQNKDKDITLHIIRVNKQAMKFWSSIFKLVLIDMNSVDALYQIKGVKT